MVSERLRDETVCVVGLGYVGLPLAEAFSKHVKVIGFDIDEVKISKLNDDDNNKYNLNIFLVNENIT